MPVKKLKDFLDQNNIKYCTINHSLAYAAHEVAACARIPARELAKTVIVKIDNQLAMAVLPASYKVDLNLLRDITGAHSVQLATENEFKVMFPECAVGAMPPFGNLYGLDVYVAETLTENEQISFNAGSHTELIKMEFMDFERLVKPKVLKFSLR
ncbi:MAG: aminoacyl-tRNA deacylase [Candidatus Zixiibacteriota bacterium]